MDNCRVEAGIVNLKNKTCGKFMAAAINTKYTREVQPHVKLLKR